MRGILIPENLENFSLSSEAQIMLAELAAGGAQKRADIEVEEIFFLRGSDEDDFQQFDADELIDLLANMNEQAENGETASDEDADKVMLHEGADSEGTKEEEEEEGESQEGLAAFEDETKSSMVALRGYADVRKAFEHETSSSPIGKTIFLIILLVLVAALPPIVNLAYIQPTITANNAKLSLMTNMHAAIVTKSKDSEKVAAQIKTVEKRILGYSRYMKKQSDFDFLFNAFLGALERYEVIILNNTLQVDESQNTKIGKNGIVETVIVDMHLQTRFDIYRNIREIFMKKIGAVKVISETMVAKPNSNLLDIKIKMGVTYLKDT